jgi:hypothetical protein
LQRVVARAAESRADHHTQITTAQLAHFGSSAAGDTVAAKRLSNNRSSADWIDTPRCAHHTFSRECVARLSFKLTRTFFEVG